MKNEASKKNKTMRKTNKKAVTRLNVLAIMMFISSCVTSDDFNVIDVTLAPVDITGFGTATGFNQVIARHNDAVDTNNDGSISIDELNNAADAVGIFSDEFDAPLYITGYVISSDREGNFFEELIIQNSTDGNAVGSDVRRGLSVQINVASLSDSYEVGRKVYIKLNGLAIGLENGVYTLGRVNGDNLAQIQGYEYQDFIKRDPEVAAITPKIIGIGGLTEADENTLIQFDNVQISRNELGLDFAGQATDQFDGFRTLESCDDGAIIRLQTSTFSDFKSAPLPENKGSIKGVFTRDFRDDFNVFIINSLTDISFEDTERCDPEILECVGAIATSMTIFEEDFQTITNENQLDTMGWTNVNVSGGNERFEDDSFSGDRYLKISAFGTNENPLEAWLVTPAINLDATSEEALRFEVSSNFETGRALTVFISNTYTGDPTTTAWTPLDIEIPVGTGGFGDFETRTTNISCLDGDVYVAFKYLGGAGGAETRYHIDDIKVTGSNQ